MRVTTDDVELPPHLPRTTVLVGGLAEQLGLDPAAAGYACVIDCGDRRSWDLAFAFVQNIDGVGAWPPVYESHVEMDGAWALFEAWIRLQLGDIDLALVSDALKPRVVAAEIDREPRTWERPSDHAPVLVTLAD